MNVVVLTQRQNYLTPTEQLGPPLTSVPFRPWFLQCRLINEKHLPEHVTTLSGNIVSAMRNLGIEPRFTRPQRVVLTTGRIPPCTYEQLECAKFLCGWGVV